MSKWTDAEKTLLESIRATLSTREVYKIFKQLNYNRSMDAIQKQSKSLGIVFRDFGWPSEEALRTLSESEASAVRDVLQQREKQLEAIEVPMGVSSAMKGEITRKTKEAATELLESLRKIRRETPRFGSISVKHPPSSGKESLVVLLSDWHVGKKSIDTDTNLETYNLDIALRRIAAIPDKVLEVITADKINQIDECVLLFAGDMVTGEGVYPHQEMSLVAHAAEQTLLTTKATWAMIQRFRDIFPFVRIVSVRGNHGRTNASPDANWDNIVYQQLELLVDMDDDPDITIRNRYGEYSNTAIKGWKVHIRHEGPAQSETAAGAIKFAGWGDIHQYDIIGIGHWHHWGINTWNRKILLRNGSLCGGDEYSEGLAKYDEPVQLIFGVSEENPCAFVYPLRLKDVT